MTDITETTTLQNAIKLYQERRARLEAEKKESKLKNFSEMEQRTRNAFAEIGMAPDRVEGQNAYFILDGQEYHFIVTKERYSFLFSRVVDKCPRCDEYRFTSRYTLEIENIGEAIVDPENMIAYHDCPNRFATNAAMEEKTTGEKLLEAIDAYIAEKSYQS